MLIYNIKLNKRTIFKIVLVLMLIICISLGIIALYTVLTSLDKKNDNIINDELHNYIPEQVVDFAPLTTEEVESIVDAKASLSSYVNESIGAFLTGSWDIDDKWDEYIAELEKIGYKEVLATYQAGYDRAH